MNKYKNMKITDGELLDVNYCILQVLKDRHLLHPNFTKKLKKLFDKIREKIENE